MYLENLTCDGLKGVGSFIVVAKADMAKRNLSVMHCPCKDCKNEKKYSHSMHLHAHLIMHGFKKNYKI